MIELVENTKLEKTKLKGAGLLTACLLLLFGCYSMGYNISANTQSPIIDQFGLTGASQGLMLSLFSFGSMLPLLVLPFMQGRIAKVWLILGSAVMEVLMLLLTGFSGSFGVLLISNTFLGVGANALDSCCNSYIVDLHPRDNSKYLGLLHGFFGIGGLLTPLIAAPIIKGSGWRASYFVMAAVIAVPMVLLAVLTLSNKRVGSSAAQNTESPLTRKMLLDYLKKPRNLLLMGVAVCYAASQLGLVNWVVRYTSVRFGDEQFGSNSLTAYWICCTLCRLVSPRLKFKPKHMLTVGALGSGVFHAAGILSGSAIGMVVASGFVGLLSGLCVPVLVSEGSRGNEDKTTLVSSMVFLMLGLSRVIAPLVMGALAESSIVVAMLVPAVAALGCGGFAYLASRIEPQ